MAGQPQMKAGAARGWEAGEQDEPPARTSMHLLARRSVRFSVNVSHSCGGSFMVEEAS